MNARNTAFENICVALVVLDEAHRMSWKRNGVDFCSRRRIDQNKRSLGVVVGIVIIVVGAAAEDADGSAGHVHDGRRVIAHSDGSQHVQRYSADDAHGVVLSQTAVGYENRRARNGDALRIRSHENVFGDGVRSDVVDRNAVGVQIGDVPFAFGIESDVAGTRTRGTGDRFDNCMRRWINNLNTVGVVDDDIRQSLMHADAVPDITERPAVDGLEDVIVHASGIRNEKAQRSIRTLEIPFIHDVQSAMDARNNGGWIRSDIIGTGGDYDKQ